MQVGRIISEFLLLLRHAFLDCIPRILDLRLVFLLTHLRLEACFVLLVPGAMVARSILFFEPLLKSVKKAMEACVRLDLKVARMHHMAVSPVDMYSCNCCDQDILHF